MDLEKEGSWIKVESVEDLKQPNIRLFYELGFKLNNLRGVDKGNWVRRGRFKEIKDVEDFVKNDTRLNDPKYIKHHNFYIECL